MNILQWKLASDDEIIDKLLPPFTQDDPSDAETSYLEAAINMQDDFPRFRFTNFKKEAIFGPTWATPFRIHMPSIPVSVKYPFFGPWNQDITNVHKHSSSPLQNEWSTLCIYQREEGSNLKQFSSFCCHLASNTYSSSFCFLNYFSGQVSKENLSHHLLIKRRLTHNWTKI